MSTVADDAVYIEALARKLKSRGWTDKQVIDEIEVQFGHPRSDIKQHLKGAGIIP